MRIGFIERTHSFLSKIFKPSSDRDTSSESIKIGSLLSGDVVNTTATAVTSTNYVSDV